MKTLNLAIATVATLTLIGCGGGGGSSSDGSTTGGIKTGGTTTGGTTTTGNTTTGNTTAGTTTGGTTTGGTTTGGSTTGGTTTDGKDPYKTDKVFYGVKKTGQTKSYDLSGAEAANQDDGHYQNGNDINYTRDTNKEVVVDYATGYMWQDNKDAETTFTGLLDDAIEYCDALELGSYSDWRLPNLRELVSIADMSKYNPAIDVNTFQHIIVESYISSDLGKEFDAGDKHYSYGKSINFSEGNPITSGGTKVRCVRNFGEIPEQKFTRDDTKKIVLDVSTKLQWQDTDEVKTAYHTWEAGIAYCEALDLAGHQDWRMPNFFELYSLFIATSQNSTPPGIDPIFQNTWSGQYFTSTTNTMSPSNANMVNFNNNLADGIGGAGYSKVPKAQSMHVRCVRNVK